MVHHLMRVRRPAKISTWRQMARLCSTQIYVREDGLGPAFIAALPSGSGSGVWAYSDDGMLSLRARV